MKKTVNINLAGTFFHIDEDAYGKLTRYLDAIKRSFSDPQGQDEIIRDIESRIAELFSEKVESKSQVISIKELDEVIAVMGQPEDYMIDEEIFEDVPPSQQAKSKERSYQKQLFRDEDNKFVAGVASGLSHYMGIDSIWVRLLWILLTVFSSGFFIVIYIIFWILVPAAVTTSDKLKMSRQQINITNIEKKLKEELDNASGKIKDADYNAVKEKAKSGASGFFGGLGSVFSALFKIFGKFIGILLIIISLSTLIGLIVGLFTTGTMGIVWGNHELMDYVNLVNTTNTPLWLFSLLALFAIGIPFFVLFILGLKMLINNLNSIGTVAKIAIFITWIVSVIGLGILGLRQATELAYDGESIEEVIIPVKAGDTLNLAMNSSNQYEYKVRRNSGFELKLNEDDEKIIYSNDVRLIVRSTQDSIGRLFIEKKAEGSSFIDAKNNAEAIEYNYTLNNNTLLLDGFLTCDIDNKYREQEVEVVLYLPEGSILFADENTYSFHRNSSHWDDILNNGDEEQYLLIQDDDTKCLDCPSFEAKIESEGWETRVNESFEYKSKKDGNSIKLNEDGLNINLSNEEDTIKIKLGN
ncbi:MAG: phage shock protein PspC (stress-responsive transcriptional regulator) [Flavobacteriaceae bacterium]|jgi:phage shock protein PspC (stress-responsive transcriptional regulator)|uniref:PspC domain-containing protein n=1 Tax=Candidatus Marifrigoribacter sp. Uisw_064 TaxID=3230970 RepID=UPI003AE391E9